MGFRRGKCRKRDLQMAVFVTVNAGSSVRRTVVQEIFLTFQNFSLRALPPAATKWNTAATKRDSSVIRSCFVYFGLTWGKLRNGIISTKVKVEHAWFYSRVQETFFTSLNLFQALHTRWAWVIITVFVSF